MERVKVAVDDSLDDVCREMALRSAVVQLVAMEDEWDALVTGSVSAVSDAVSRNKRVLWLSPFRAIPDNSAFTADGSLSDSVMPGHAARFHPSTAAVHEALDQGHLGQPGLLRIHCWHPNAGNIETQLSELDLALWLFGEVPDHVYAVQRVCYRQVHLGFASGGMALIDFDSSVAAGSRYYSLSLIGSDGAAYADDHHNMNLVLKDNRVQSLNVSQGNLALAAMIHQFAAAIGEGRPFPVTPAETNEVLALTDRVQNSLRGDFVVGEGHYV